MAVTDAAGAALRINAYETFGRPAATNLGRFQFTGQVFLLQTGLYHYKARAYHPALGRFLQPDPLGYDAGDMNLYAYVGNDPINARDPWGLIDTTVITAPRIDPGRGAEQRFDLSSSLGAVALTFGGDVAGGLIEIGRDPHAISGVSALASAPDVNATTKITAQRLAAPKGYMTWAQYYFVHARNASSDRLWGEVSEFYLENVLLNALPAGRVGQLAGCATCFGAGTSVQTPDGLRAIESLKVGDLVLAYDETSGRIEPKPVAALIRPLAKALLDVEIAVENGQVTRLAATADHPWLVVRGEGATVWAETIDLKPGDRLVTADGNGAVFRSATLRKGLPQTYNLEVADHHTFLLGTGMVVHNAACDVAKGVAQWLGASFGTTRTPGGNLVATSADGLRRFRIDFNQKSGKFGGPHAQFESRLARNRPFGPAPGTPRHVYFRQN